MKAIVQDRYGAPEQLELRDVDTPALKDDEVLVRVRATSVHPDVWHVVYGRPYALRLMGAGLLHPKRRIPGTDMAGTVESLGRSVTRFKIGDDVFGETMRGYQWNNGGAYADYVAVPEMNLAKKPANVTHEQAAAVPTSGLIALSSLVHQGKLQSGQHVLINGAGGGVGAIAVQLAKALGAQVTAVDAPEKLDMLRALGADHIVDYTREDFTGSDVRYDLVLDIPGNRSFSECRRVLKEEGNYVLVGHDQYGAAGARWLGSLPRFFKLVLRAPFSKNLPPVSFSMPNKRDAMERFAALLAEGKLTPRIDRTFPLKDAAAAIRYLEGGRSVGKVLLVVAA